MKIKPCKNKELKKKKIYISIYINMIMANIYLFGAKKRYTQVNDNYGEQTLGEQIQMSETDVYQMGTYDRLYLTVVKKNLINIIMFVVLNQVH